MSRGGALLVAAAAAVLVLAAAAVGLRAWFEQGPPPLDESGPGTALRLTRGSGGVPPPRYGVRLPDGSTTSVAMSAITTDRGRAVGDLTVFPSGGEPQQLALAEGQSGDAGGVTVTVVHVWRMRDQANDAIDVRVVPASRGG